MLELTPQQLNSYLRAGLACSATPWEETPGLLRRAFGWHLHLVQRGFEHIPCFLALDLAMALTRGPSARMRSEREYARWPEEERGVRLRYERELLYRVSTHQGLRPLFEVESAVSDAMLLHALCLICGGLEAAWPRLIRHRHAQLNTVSTALARAHSEPVTPDERAGLEADLCAHLGEGARVIAQLKALLDALSTSPAWRAGLVSAQDLFELRHLDRLMDDSLRLGCRQLALFSERLGAVDPREVILPREDAAADSAFLDDTTYPTGGLTELTTSGAWENLVLSELAYIDGSANDSANDSAGEIDLFDVRFVESELLFYLRDEGQLSCKRRTLHLVIDLGERFLFKTRGYECSFSVLSMGLCLSLLRDLSALYLGDSLLCEVWCVTRGVEHERAEQELRLLSLLLLEEEQRGLVRFHVVKDFNVSDLEDSRRERRACVITGREHLDEWRARLAPLRREGVSAVCAALTPMGSFDLREPPPAPRRQASYAEIELPLSGLNGGQLASLKRWLVARVAGARLRVPLAAGDTPREGGSA